MEENEKIFFIDLIQSKSVYFLLIIILEDLVRTIRQEKETKDVRIIKHELKFSLTVNDMIIYAENLKTEQNFKKMFGPLN